MKKSNVLNAYAAYINDDNLRFNSSSGGIFTAAAEYVLKNGGVVYGVSMSADCLRAIFTRVECVDDLDCLRGSKYMQAIVGDTYKNVRSDLEKGLLVLFSGVGCQVNGLKHYLGKEYNNLICIDVVCHGAPSQKLWETYVTDLEKKYSSKLVSVNFRCKDKERYNFDRRGIIADKTIFVPKGQDPYMLMFLDNYCLRPSCYECSAKTYRLSDFSLADFWGAEDVCPEMLIGNGISLIITRTERGEDLLHKLLPNITISKVLYDDAVKENSAEVCSVSRPLERDVFFEDLDSLPFETVRKKYAIPVRIPLKNRFKKFINCLLHPQAKGKDAYRNFGIKMLFKTR